MVILSACGIPRETKLTAVGYSRPRIRQTTIVGYDRQWICQHIDTGMSDMAILQIMRIWPFSKLRGNGHSPNYDNVHNAPLFHHPRATPTRNYYQTANLSHFLNQRKTSTVLLNFDTLINIAKLLSYHSFMYSPTNSFQ